MSDCSTNAFNIPEGMCSCNRSRGYDDLQQRHQQLEQVARIMLKDYMEIYEIAEQRLGTYWMHQEFSSPKGIKKRLEDLGVSLDD